MKQPLTGREWQRIAAILILAAVSVLFFIGWDQSGGLVTIFAEKNTNRMLGGWEIPPSWFFALNPFIVFFAAPFIASLWDRLAAQGRAVSVSHKVAIGLGMTGLAFVIMVFASQHAAASGQAHWFWLILFYLAISVGELCINPILWSAVSRWAPQRLLSMLMAVMLASIGIGAKLAGTLGGLVTRLGPEQIFLMVAGLMGALAVILLFLNRPIHRMTDAVEAEASETEAIAG